MRSRADAPMDTLDLLLLPSLMHGGRRNFPETLDNQQMRTVEKAIEGFRHRPSWRSSPSVKCQHINGPPVRVAKPWNCTHVQPSVRLAVIVGETEPLLNLRIFHRRERGAVRVFN